MYIDFRSLLHGIKSILHGMRSILHGIRCVLHRIEMSHHSSFTFMLVIIHVAEEGLGGNTHTHTHTHRHTHTVPANPCLVKYLSFTLIAGLIYIDRSSD
jgi:hypothetical protein